MDTQQWTGAAARRIASATVACVVGSSVGMFAVGACGNLGFNPLSSSGTEAPVVTIQNALASRDATTGLPNVSLEYSVTYPSDLFAQTASQITLNCTMEQGQLTQTRRFTGASTVTGFDRGPHTGRVVISVPEDGRSIQGAFTIGCTLRSDRDLATSNTLSVTVPAPGTGGAGGATSFPCSDGTTIDPNRVCNGANDCPDGKDEDPATCGTPSNCCVATNNCPGETGANCANSCCCCGPGARCCPDNSGCCASP